MHRRYHKFYGPDKEHLQVGFIGGKIDDFLGETSMSEGSSVTPIAANNILATTDLVPLSA